jgi:hypothetical protein
MLRCFNRYPDRRTACPNSDAPSGRDRSSQRRGRSCFLSRRLVLASRRPAAPFHHLLRFRQPCRRASPAFALTACQTFETQDCFFELIALLAQVTKDFAYVHCLNSCKFFFRNSTDYSLSRSRSGTQTRSAVFLVQLLTHWIERAQGLCSISGTNFLNRYQNRGWDGEKINGRAALPFSWSSIDKTVIPLKSIEFRQWTRVADAPGY